jgi:hypothetical protein
MLEDKNKGATMGKRHETLDVVEAQGIFDSLVDRVNHATSRVNINTMDIQTIADRVIGSEPTAGPSEGKDHPTPDGKVIVLHEALEALNNAIVAQEYHITRLARL